MDKLATMDTIGSSFRPWLSCQGICLLNRHQTGDTDSVQPVILLPVQRDSQETFIPCEARMLWYSADRTSSQQLRDTTKFTYDKLKARTATVIAGDTVGTIELVMGFARAFEEAGGKVVQELYAPIGTTDFGPFIGRIRRDVDVVAALVAGADGIRFINQYEEFGLKGKIQVVDTAPGITDIALLPSSGPAALGMYASQPYVYTIDNPRNQQFVQAFRTKYGRAPGGP